MRIIRVRIIIRTRSYLLAKKVISKENNIEIRFILEV
jgi:hypothetical protein